jgi:hypothetical protein
MKRLAIASFALGFLFAGAAEARGTVTRWNTTLEHGRINTRIETSQLPAGFHPGERLLVEDGSYGPEAHPNACGAAFEALTVGEASNTCHGN